MDQSTIINCSSVIYCNPKNQSSSANCFENCQYHNTPALIIGSYQVGIFYLNLTNNNVSPLGNSICGIEVSASNDIYAYGLTVSNSSSGSAISFKGEGSKLIDFANFANIGLYKSVPLFDFSGTTLTVSSSIIFNCGPGPIMIETEFSHPELILRNCKIDQNVPQNLDIDAYKNEFNKAHLTMQNIDYMNSGECFYQNPSDKLSTTVIIIIVVSSCVLLAIIIIIIVVVVKKCKRKKMEYEDENEDI